VLVGGLEVAEEPLAPEIHIRPFPRGTEVGGRGWVLGDEIVLSLGAPSFGVSGRPTGSIKTLRTLP
jgi:hypothetical protein